MPHLFGAKLRHVRHIATLTQGELAKQLGLASYTYVYRLEADQRDPSLPFVVRLSLLLGQSTDYFLRDTIPIEDAQAVSRPHHGANEATMDLLGEKLRGLRLQKGWSQTEVTRMLGYKHPSLVNNLEAARKAPSLDLVVQLADLFGVTTDYFLFDTIALQNPSTPLQSDS